VTVEWRDQELEELDEELAAAKANLRRLRDRAVHRLEQELATETNPYHREWLIKSIDKAKATVVD